MWVEDGVSGEKQGWENISIWSQATLEELKASYRRLCMLYHPDKHRDPELKIQAEQLFNQVHQAFEGKDMRWTLVLWSIEQQSSYKNYDKNQTFKNVFLYVTSANTGGKGGGAGHNRTRLK